MFLGYSSIHKGYKFLHISTNIVYISRGVVFDETVFPFSHLASSSTPPASSITLLHSGQFVDVAYSPVPLSNHDAGHPRARLEVLVESPAPSTAHVDPGVIYVAPLHGVAAPHAAWAPDGGPTTPVPLQARMRSTRLCLVQHIAARHHRLIGRIQRWVIWPPPLLVRRQRRIPLLLMLPLLLILTQLLACSGVFGSLRSVLMAPLHTLLLTMVILLF
jgi:hypothetical protein